MVSLKIRIGNKIYKISLFDLIVLSVVAKYKVVPKFYIAKKLPDEIDYIVLRKDKITHRKILKSLDNLKKLGLISVINLTYYRKTYSRAPYILAEVLLNEFPFLKKIGLDKYSLEELLKQYSRYKTLLVVSPDVDYKSVKELIEIITKLRNTILEFANRKNEKAATSSDK